MKRIFVSYSRKDEAFARKLNTALLAAGADVWIDVEDIAAGMKWSAAIQEGLDASDVLLVILSPDSMASSNVEDEWQYFMDQGQPVIPILWRPTKIHFQLNRLQYIDFHNQGFDAGMAALLVELANKGLPLDVAAKQVATPQSKPETPAATESKPTPTPSPSTSSDSGCSWWVIGGIVVLLLWSNNGDSNSPETTSPPQATVAVTEALNAPEDAASYEDFSSPSPSYIYHGDPFSAHQELDSGAMLAEAIGFAQIPYRRYSETDGQIWFRILDIEREQEGWQIRTNIPYLEADEALLIPFLSEQYVSESEEMTLYAAPDVGSPTQNVWVQEVLYYYGFSLDGEGHLWYQVEYPAPEGNLVAWIKRTDETDPFTPMPVIATLYTTIAYDDDLQEISDFALDMEQDVRIYNALRDDNESIWVHAGASIDDAWQTFWLPVGDVYLSEASYAYILDVAGLQD